MSADHETQGEMDESQLPGPGAPTPLSALEVGVFSPKELDSNLDAISKAILIDLS